VICFPIRAEVADQLEDIRMEVLSTVAAAESEVQSETSAASRKLSALDWERTEPEGIQRDFKTLLEDPEAGFGRDRLGQFDRDTLVQLLKERQDISSEEADQIIAQLENPRFCIDNGSRTTRCGEIPKHKSWQGRSLSA